MKLYVASDCPHSRSMLQLLRMCEVSVETLDVKSVSVPHDVLGTPAIVLDDKVYHGDHAFDMLEKLRDQGLQQESGSIDPAVMQATASAGNSDKTASPALVDPAEVTSLFDAQPMVPRQ